VEFPIRITFVTSQDYQTRQLITEEGNLTGPIRTRHYLEPQLKGYVPSHHSMNTNKPTFKISYKPCRPRTSK